MVYPILLATHSVVRWLLLAALLYSLYRAYAGWLQQKVFTKLDNAVRHYTATIAHVQLVLGLWLYTISPLTTYFIHNYKEAIHARELRFFGMEHITMMILAVVVLTIGSMVTKRKPTDAQKFKTMALWYTAVLLIIISSVPWPFSPLTSRPWFRPFW